MKNSATTFGGYYYEQWVDRVFGSGTGSRIMPATRAQYTLHNVTSDGSKINGVIQKIVKPHSYIHDVDTGRSGGHTSQKTDVNGKLIYQSSKYGDFGNNESTPLFSDLGSYNIAIEKLTELVRGGIDLSIDGFQIQQTIKLAKRILSVRKIVEHLAEKTWKDESAKRRRYSKVLRSRANAKTRDRRDRFERREVLERTPMKELGGLHLEFTYGLKPTMQTIFDLVKGNAVRAGNSIELRSPGQRFHGVNGSYKDKRIAKTQAFGTFLTTVNESNYRCKIGGYYVPGNSFVESLSRLTSLNPASIAWELLPFSFVVDWFVDVGGYLRSMETALVSRLGTFRGYQTMTARHSITVSELRGGIDSGGYTIAGATESSKYRQTMSRVVLNSFPLPRLPSFRADLGSSRLINAAALLSQFLGRK